MVNNINEVPKNSWKYLNCFWHSEDGSVPDLVMMSMKSWVLQGHIINVWTLGRVYDFGVEVNTIDLTSMCDDIPYDMMYCQKKPLGKEGRTITGFVDWCRFKMMSLMEDGMTIMDTDVVLLKQYPYYYTTIVCEESFRAGNKLNGLYPVAGIISTRDNSMGLWLLDKANKIMEDGMEHGKLMNLVYQWVLKNKEYYTLTKPFSAGNTFLESAKYGWDFIVGHQEFFELGYDELDRFYEKVSKSTLRRIKDVTGIHCWMGVLDQEEAFQEGTLLSTLWTLIMKHDCKPNYDLLKLTQTEI